MTMSFRIVKAAVEQLLVDNRTAGGYRVLGYDDDAIGSEFLTGTNRLVQVYNQSGNFNNKASGYVGSVTHDPVINIDVTTAKKAKADLTVADNPDATEAQLMAALAASQNASKLADDDADEFIDYVYQLLMSPVNIFMGLPPGTISNRWIPRWQKSKPINQGGLVIITAALDYHYRTNEDLVGETPLSATEGVHGGVKVEGDTKIRAGIIAIDEDL